MDRTKNNKVVKFVVFVPEGHANIVRETLGKAGAGQVGDYSFCSFSTKGAGRYFPSEAANPAIGKKGKLNKVIEEKIETVCFKKDLPKIIKAVKKVHPYEEIAFDIYPLVLNPYKITYNK